jgi:TubC N-terminal docking domain
MQNGFRFLSSLIHKGISVSFVNGFLKVEPKALLTDKIRIGVKKHKAELIEVLLNNVSSNPQRYDKVSISSCWACQYYFAEGSSWPGMCRYFELLGQEAKEIDFYSVDPNKGCRFFLKSTHSIISTPKAAELIDLSEMTQSSVVTSNIRSTSINLPSPIALAWLLEHRDALDKAGWTRPELYRRNKSKRSIAWLKLWDMPFLQVYLHDSGVIEFECSINNRDFFQTTIPNRKPYEANFDSLYLP